MSNILITGTTGFLGKNLLERVIEDNNVWCVHRNDSIVKEEVEEFNPDYIYHFAAEIYDDSKMIDSNILLTYNLLEATKDISFKAFVNVGSSSEYGLKKNPMNESDVLVPRTMYEATKGSATLLCQAYATIYDKPIVTVRPFSVYGNHEKDHRFIPTLFKSFIEKTPMSISPGVHDFIYIDDFIDAVLLISKSESSRIKGDIVNIGCGEQWTNKQVYEIFVELFGYEVGANFIENKLRSFDTTNSWVADISNLKTKYKYFPKHSLKDGLSKMYTLNMEILNGK